MGWYMVYKIEFSHMCKNSRNRDLVCKKYLLMLNVSGWEPVYLEAYILYIANNMDPDQTAFLGSSLIRVQSVR